MPTYVPIVDAEIAAEQPITVSLMTRLRDNTLSYWGAPTGTIALAGNTTAPVGWGKLTDFNDVAIRVTTGSASFGGSSPFTTVFGKTATDGYTLVLADLPNPTRTVSLSGTLGVPLSGTLPVTLSGTLGVSLSGTINVPLSGNVAARNAGAAQMLGVNTGVGVAAVQAGGAPTVNIFEAGNYEAILVNLAEGSGSVNLADPNGSASVNIGTGTASVNLAHPNGSASVNLATGSGSMTIGGSSAPHAHGMDLRVAYVDVIRIQKSA